jgi:hypothetical protein
LNLVQDVCLHLIKQILTLLELKLSCSFDGSGNSLRVAQPSEPLSFLELTLTFGVTQKIYLKSNTVLQVIFPLTSVLFLSWNCKSALSFLLSINKFTHVLSPISPNFLTLSRGDTFYKLTVVCLLLIREVVLSLAMENTILKITLVVASVCPIESSFAVFFTLNERAHKLHSAICPSFDSCSM